MGDPLSDPRAQKLLSASTGEIASLAGAFRAVGVQAEVAAAGLRGAQGDAGWTGQAASAFRAQVGKLPGQLDRVQHSYNEVATALYRYESGLGPVQSQFRSLATQLQSARASLATAQGQLTTARSDLSSATAAPHAKPSSPAVVNANAAVANAAGAVGNLGDQVSGLQTRGYHLLDEFDSIRGHATAAVSGAAGTAPSQSWLMGALSDVGNAFADAGKFLYGVGKGIVDDVGNLPAAIDNVYEHPGDLTAWGTLVKDVAVTASVVAMVAAPFAAPELAEADAAVDGAAAATGEGAATGEAAATGGQATEDASGFGTAMRGVTTWSSRAAMGGNLAQSGIQAGEGDWKGAGIDLAFAVAPSAGDAATNALGIGERQADEAAVDYTTLSDAKDSVSDYQQLREWGIGPDQAQNMAFENGLPEKLANTDLTDRGAFDQALHNQRDEMVSTANTAMHVGKPVAGVVDRLTEPLEDRIKDRLAPAAAHP